MRQFSGLGLAHQLRIRSLPVTRDNYISPSPGRNTSFLHVLDQTENGGTKLVRHDVLDQGVLGMGRNNSTYMAMKYKSTSDVEDAGRPGIVL